MATEKPTTKLIKKADRPQAKRVMRGQEQVHHDLYVLEATNTVKNESFNKNPMWVNINHGHKFHSCDSKGVKIDKSAPSAGHFHFMTEHEDEEGNLSATCSIPYTMGLVDGKKKAVPYTNDNHTHKVTYINSETFTARMPSEEGLKAISNIVNKEAERLRNPAL